MLQLTDEELNITVEAEECKPKETNMQTTTIATESEGCQEVQYQRASSMLPTGGSVSHSETADPQALKESLVRNCYELPQEHTTTVNRRA